MDIATEFHLKETGQNMESGRLDLMEKFWNMAIPAIDKKGIVLIAPPPPPPPTCNSLICFCGAFYPYSIGITYNFFSLADSHRTCPTALLIVEQVPYRKLMLK
jgi:hypothetical protein